MKLGHVLKVIILTFLTTFFFISAFSVELPNCCYGTGGEINVKLSCGAGEIDLGKTDSSISCDHITSKRVGCFTNGNCQPTLPDGRKIYNVATVSATQLLNDIGAGTYCASYQDPFNSVTCTGGTSSSSGGVTVGTNDTSIPITITTGNPYQVPENLDNSRNNVTIPINEREACEDAGSAYGLFSTKDSCDQVEIDGDNICVYNPKRLSIFSTMPDLGLGSLMDFSDSDSACVHKLTIKACSDYNLKDNCLNNSAQLPDSCTWLNSAQYETAHTTSLADGICVSTPKPYANDHLERIPMQFRGNLMPDPSFESIGITADFAYDRQKVGEFQPATPKTYEIIVPTNNLNLILFGHVLWQDFTTETLTISYSATDFNGNSVSIPSKTYSFYDLNASGFVETPLKGAFTRVIFDRSIVLEDIYNLTMTLTFSGTDPLYLDALYFGPSSLETPDIRSITYVPTQIMPKEATYCDSCFEEGDLNSCTKLKSDLIGSCTYMVQDVTDKYNPDESLPNFFGKEEIEFIRNSNEIERWKFQSISDAEVFCELYETQAQCLDPNNFMNSHIAPLHQVASLCKWKPDYGCYKDSNNDNALDTSINLSIHQNTMISGHIATKVRELNEHWSAFDDFSSYSYSAQASYPSDFALGCDYLPPTAYYYFIGRNSSGEQIAITSSSTEIVGDMFIKIVVDDVVPQACEDYEFDSSIALDVEVGDGAQRLHTTKYFDSNQVNFYMDVKEFFQNATGDNMLFEMVNHFSLRVSDSSGNIREIRDVELSGLDVLGPNITLNSPASTEMGSTTENLFKLDSYASINEIFDFTIKDLTSGQCSFRFAPVDGARPVNPNYYNASTAHFNYTQGTDTYSIQVRDFIYNTDILGDFYVLDINCSDIFAQETRNIYYFKADFRTEFKLLEPHYFVDRNFDEGYLNNRTPFWGISGENDSALDCRLYFPNLVTSPVLTSQYYPQGFNHSLYPGMTFHNNLTGEIEFSTNGLHNGSIKCTDSHSNSFTLNLSYYYDDVRPIFENFELINIKSGDVNSVLKVGTNYYTISTNTKANITVDGTHSWVKNELVKDFFRYNESGIQGSVHVGFRTQVLDHNISQSSKADLLVWGFEEPIAYIGYKTAENNLYTKKFSFVVSDMARNNQTIPFEYYFDTSVPSFNFSGDIVTQISSQLFTRSQDPNVEITFNTPSYREFACSVDLVRSRFGQPPSYFTRDFGKTSTLNMRYSAFAGLSVTQGDIISFDIDCVDDYNISISGNYEIVYDNTRPVLDEIYLSSGDYMYLQGTVFDDIVDSLTFKLNNTNETYYDCEYKVESYYYTCNNSWRANRFASSVPPIFQVPDINLVGGQLGTDDGICQRPNSLKTQIRNIPIGDTLNTSLRITGRCEDTVKLQTSDETFEYNIIYINLDSSLQSFTLEANTNTRTFVPNVTSFIRYEEIWILDDLSNNTPLLTLRSPSTISRPGLNEYFYTDSTGVSYDALEEGPQRYYAVGVNLGSKVSGSELSADVIVDKTKPNVEISIPDNFNGNVYSSTFNILFSARDMGELSKVDVYSNANRIFTSTNLSNFNSIQTPDGSRNYFYGADTQYSGDIVYTGGVYGQSYEFLVRAYDKMGNYNDSRVYVNVSDGVVMWLLNSTNSKVDVSTLGWITAQDKPTIKFTLSKSDIDSCSFSPFADSAWADAGVIDSSIQSFQKVGNDFIFDLNTLPNFDLSLIDSQTVDFVINCAYNRTNYQYVRYLQKIDYLPDYVLTSQRGFYLNEEPYKLNVSVKSVGPYRYVTCNYGFDVNAISNPIENGIFATQFTQELDFTSFTDGQKSIFLRCQDTLGNIGPTKEFVFGVYKNEPIRISNISFKVGSNVYPEDNNRILLDSNTQYELSFMTNKKSSSGVECKYQLTEQGGIFNWVTNFFGNLFGTNQKAVSFNDNPYEAKDSVTINSANNQLVVICEDSLGNTASETILVEKLTTNLNVSIS